MPVSGVSGLQGWLSDMDRGLTNGQGHHPPRELVSRFRELVQMGGRLGWTELDWVGLGWTGLRVDEGLAATPWRVSCRAVCC